MYLFIYEKSVKLNFQRHCCLKIYFRVDDAFVRREFGTQSLVPIYTKPSTFSHRPNSRLMVIKCSKSLSRTKPIVNLV